MNENNMVLPVTPVNNGGFGGMSGDIWLIIILLFCFGGWGGMGGFGGWGMGGFAADGAMLYPWMNQAQITTNGFQNQALNTAVSGLQNAVTAGFGDVQLGIAGVNQNISNVGAGIQNSLCCGFNGVNQSINSAQSAITSQLYNNEIANLNRSFAEQTANTQGFSNVQNQLAQASSDNRLATCQLNNTVQNEGNATRFADATNTRDIIDNQSRGIQAIMDKLCQLELDNVKTQLDAKNDLIAQLRQENLYARGQASQVAQTADIRANNAQVANQLMSELRSCPIPAQPVYGSTPIFSCNGNYSGCGCNA